MEQVERIQQWHGNNESGTVDLGNNFSEPHGSVWDCAADIASGIASLAADASLEQLPRGYQAVSVELGGQATDILVKDGYPINFGDGNVIGNRMMDENQANSLGLKCEQAFNAGQPVPGKSVFADVPFAVMKYFAGDVAGGMLSEIANVVNKSIEGQEAYYGEKVTLSDRSREVLDGLKELKNYQQEKSADNGKGIEAEGNKREVSEISKDTDQKATSVSEKGTITTEKDREAKVAEYKDEIEIAANTIEGTITAAKLQEALKDNGINLTHREAQLALKTMAEESKLYVQEFGNTGKETTYSFTAPELGKSAILTEAKQTEAAKPETEKQAEGKGQAHEHGYADQAKESREASKGAGKVKEGEGVDKGAGKVGAGKMPGKTEGLDMTTMTNANSFSAMHVAKQNNAPFEPLKAGAAKGSHENFETIGNGKNGKGQGESKGSLPDKIQKAQAEAGDKGAQAAQQSKGKSQGDGGKGMEYGDR